MDYPKVSIIIPVFNEEETVVECLRLADRVLKENGMVYEIIVVDDGSKDKTLYKLREVECELPVIIRHHSKNMGKGKAVKTGLKASSGNIICILDADLEYSPKDIPNLISSIVKGESSVVYGSRFLGEINGMSFTHRFGNVVLTTVANILYGLRITDVMTGSKVFKREVLERIDLDSNGFEFEIEVTLKLAKIKAKIDEIPISYTRRKLFLLGKSRFFLSGSRGLFKD